MILSLLSLRNKLLMISSVLVLSMGVLLGVLAERNGRTSLQLVIGRQLAREAVHTADRLATLIHAERESLESFSRQGVMRQIRVVDLDKQIAQALVALTTGGEARVGYAVVDGGGELVASSAPEWLLERPEWSSAVVEKNAIVGLTEEGPGQSVLVIATPIFDPDGPGTRIGSLFGVLDWERLTDVTAEVRSELEAQDIAAEVAIVSARGRLLRHSRDEGRSGSIVESPASLALSAGAQADYYVDADAGLIIGRSALAEPLQAWTVLIIEPLSHALAPALVLRNRIGLTTGLVLIVVLIGTTLGARRFVRPLTELTAAIQEMSRGDAARVLVPVRSEDEVGTLAVAFNKMTRDLDETQRHLVEAEKFAFVGELAAGVAHEVRTSLGVLRSSAQIIARELESEVDDSVREMIGMIQAEVERLGRVVDDLLTLDHRRPLDLRAMRLSEPLSAAVEFVRPQAEEKSIALRCHFEDDDPLVSVDRDAIQQVVVNLLANAIASIDDGERIELRIEPAEGRSARFSVRDSGPGIPPELAARIFDPFVTGRDSGVGLGLTFVKRILHTHRGSIELETEEGQGACFRISLPLLTSLEVER